MANKCGLSVGILIKPYDFSDDASYLLDQTLLKPKSSIAEEHLIKSVWKIIWLAYESESFPVPWCTEFQSQMDTTISFQIILQLLALCLLIRSVPQNSQITI